jgi:hypothetical protein
MGLKSFVTDIGVSVFMRTSVHKYVTRMLQNVTLELRLQWILYGDPKTLNVDMR